MTPYQQIEELVELGYKVSIEFITKFYYVDVKVEGTMVAEKQSESMPDAIDQLYKELKYKGKL